MLINIWWFEATWFCNKMKSHSAAHAVNKNLQFCNEPFSCSCCNQYLMFWSNKMKSYSAAIAVNKNLQFMQYTLSSLLSSFPWTTQKSIIVENSKIVENFGATVFSTIMEFDCTYLDSRQSERSECHSNHFRNPPYQRSEHFLIRANWYWSGLWQNNIFIQRAFLT